ncbi:hypothetical protein J6590_030777 [Homalodisca vitripennis]|nr:hypothetical protein J6590_030777 [Homalodisca vitripennis]
MSVGTITQDNEGRRSDASSAVASPEGHIGRLFHFSRPNLKVCEERYSKRPSMVGVTPESICKSCMQDNTVLAKDRQTILVSILLTSDQTTELQLHHIFHTKSFTIQLITLSSCLLTQIPKWCTRSLGDFPQSDLGRGLRCAQTRGSVAVRLRRNFKVVQAVATAPGPPACGTHPIIIIKATVLRPARARVLCHGTELRHSGPLSGETLCQVTHRRGDTTTRSYAAGFRLE